MSDYSLSRTHGGPMRKSTAPPRSRAARMPSEARRESIVAAALPLVRRNGSRVLTADVARAAGIAEGTLFRVFPDKEALLTACLEQVADTSEVHRTLTGISAPDLAAAVEAAVEAMLAHLAAAMPVVMQVTSTGPTPAGALGLRARLTEQTSTELADLLRRYESALRRPLPEATAILHSLVLGAAVQQRPPSAALLADAFVHGCATPTG
ncbi:MAG TPA: TetR/AcrR family transcriptional regulator [Candidatus Nanopelagicales bacterium]|nr:TetR/AcrR family transcriptional regulator [Candidatus Nanopelagicales bacterium]